jgi:hypothetical protein
MSAHPLGTAHGERRGERSTVFWNNTSGVLRILFDRKTLEIFTVRRKTGFMAVSLGVVES